MPAPAAKMTIPVNVAATASGELVQLSFEVCVSSDGEMQLLIWQRQTGSNHAKVLADFDAYEFERFRKAIGECGELMQAIQERGATFKIG